MRRCLPLFEQLMTKGASKVKKFCRGVGTERFRFLSSQYDMYYVGVNVSVEGKMVLLGFYVLLCGERTRAREAEQIVQTHVRVHSNRWMD